MRTVLLASFLFIIFALAVYGLGTVSGSVSGLWFIILGLGLVLLYVGLPLFVLYATVRFIKWSWNR